MTKPKIRVMHQNRINQRVEETFRAALGVLENVENSPEVAKGVLTCLVDTGKLAGEVGDDPRATAVAVMCEAILALQPELRDHYNELAMKK